MTPRDLLVVAKAIGPLFDGLRQTLAGVEQRLAAVEIRAAQPGPPGPPGPMGPDGLGFDDMTADWVGQRTLRFTWARGDRVKTHEVSLTGFPDVDPDDLAWRADKTYHRGDIVQLHGAWIARGTSVGMRPGSGADAAASWKLFLKAGKDGRDGKPGPKGEDARR
jgi:hypothetical protein